MIHWGNNKKGKHQIRFATQIQQQAGDIKEHLICAKVHLDLREEGRLLLMYCEYVGTEIIKDPTVAKT